MRTDDQLISLDTRLHDLSDKLPGLFDVSSKITLDDTETFDELTKVTDELWQLVREQQVSTDLAQSEIRQART